jgi:microcystin-dependent protein
LATNTTPYIGEIRMFAGNFAPAGWAFCDGQLLAISTNSALFQLIGTFYGGDGQATFALPNLQSRFPVHQGTGFAIGQTGGTETVTLTAQQMPAHSHVPEAYNGQGTASSPSSNVWAESALNNYSATAPSASMDPAALGTAGGSQPHDNMPPYLVINFIIALFGVYPTQN